MTHEDKSAGVMSPIRLKPSPLTGPNYTTAAPAIVTKQTLVVKRDIETYPLAPVLSHRLEKEKVGLHSVTSDHISNESEHTCHQSRYPCESGPASR